MSASSTTKDKDNITYEEIEDPLRRHLFDNNEFLNPYNTDVICLSAGSPGPSLLKRCVPMFEEATKHRLGLEKENAFLFQYGMTAGHWDYREELSRFLTKRYGDKVNRQDIILTCGANHGLVFILNTFLPNDGVIFVEDPTYWGSLYIFQHFSSMKLVPVPMNNEGIDTEALQKIVAEEKSKRTWNLTEEKMFWGMVFTIPVLHNPTGIVASQKCSQELVRIAREMNLLVVSDDVYNLVYYDKNRCPPRRLFSYDRYTEGYIGGNVIAIGSFSKILSPGIRIGWLEAGPRMAKVLRSSKILAASGSVNNYVSGIMASVLELGLMETHLEFLIDTLKAHMTALCDTLDEFLPEYCSYRRPDGGYFVWIQLPEFVNATKFNAWCTEKYKVDATPGDLFSASGKFANCLRLSIGFHGSEVTTRAVKDLCCGIADYVKNELNSPQILVSG